MPAAASIRICRPYGTGFEKWVASQPSDESLGYWQRVPTGQMAHETRATAGTCWTSHGLFVTLCARLATLEILDSQGVVVFRRGPPPLALTHAGTSAVRKIPIRVPQRIEDGINQPAGTTTTTAGATITGASAARQEQANQSELQKSAHGGPPWQRCGPGLSHNWRVLARPNGSSSRQRLGGVESQSSLMRQLET